MESHVFSACTEERLDNSAQDELLPFFPRVHGRAGAFPQTGKLYGVSSARARKNGECFAGKRVCMESGFVRECHGNRERFFRACMEERSSSAAAPVL
jgi:hypothetical protein